MNRYEVLEMLVLADGSVVSPGELFERVWDERADPFSNPVTVSR